MKFVKRLLIIVGSLLIVAFIGFKVLQHQTKKASPEETVTYAQGDLKIDVYYNRPSKKGRAIFGGLVPYGEVWRTGANEATTFTTNKDLVIGGRTVAAGKYSLWTIPNETEWKVILNTKVPGWGVDFDSKASREPASDIVEVTVPVQPLDHEVEQFTITVPQENGVPALVLEWDRTRVVVPIGQ
ncbi:MAG TPA: DUF2911 domain-containing protein [Flavobacteriales bacterium]